MSNRNWMLMSFAAGAIVGIGGLVWLMTREKPGSRSDNGAESIAAAAEPIVGSPAVTLMEYGPSQKGEKMTCRAFRRQDSGSPVQYGVTIPWFIDYLVVESDIKSLLDFWAKYSEFKLPESKDRTEMVASWSARSLTIKDPIVITFDIVTGKLTLFGLPFEMEKAIPTIQAAYKDIEALKKVPISAKP